MSNESLIGILQKHLNYRRCDDEWYLSRDQLAVLKGELLAYEAKNEKEISLLRADLKELTNADERAIRRESQIRSGGYAS